ncbi:hypothetical protein [Schleiferilactobacillus harbinensis]|uniref:Uncharacterized protein n=1 Tax=Schleiferilactobacillus harbinensis TaxID=304207 RepID=A0A5P8M320_9LACO|nr:hypothetical protein [Schleiferilactobacillus harbinensis]QFR22521.1 hypothetical protein D1010_03170 [Schleiferilactobacillus harbinensis]
MTETVKDVFDELWKRYELVCSDLELEIGQGCPRGPRGLSGYDMTIRQRFLKALKTESKEQQKCPYCHATMGNKVVGKIVAYNDYRFCPMCGRRLEEANAGAE